jgi:hypothetical protein
MSLPTGLLGILGSNIVGMQVVAGAGMSITFSSNIYQIGFTGTASPGTVLQTTTFSLINSYTPTQAWSTTYNPSSLVTTISLNTLSSNSFIQVIPGIIALTTGGGVSVGIWVNQTGNPLGACPVLQPGTSAVYNPTLAFFQYANTTLGQNVNVNVCSFYTPSPATSSNNRLLGASDGFSYNGALVSQIIVSEVQA